MTHGKMSKRGTSGWHDATRRGAILGGTAALHLTVVMLLLHLPPHRSMPPSSRSHDVLRIRFLSLPARPPSPHHEAPPAAQPLPTTPRHATTTASSQGLTSAAPPPVTAGSVARPLHAEPSGYRPGTFRVELLGAQSSHRPRLPGSDAPSRTNIRLRARSSMKDVVHAMTVGNRCKYERMKMQQSTTEFITPQLMERALEADGCGPQGERTPADGVIEATSRRAVFGD